MHLATYSKGDAGAMLAHYERSIGERDHIDRDGVVYNLAPEHEGGCHARFEELCDGLEIGAKTRPLADFVVTKPLGFRGDTGDFFKAVYGFLRGVVGDERVVAAYVHLDEPGAEPHMHFAFVPVVESEVMTNDKSRPLRWTAKDEKKNPAHRAGEVKKDSKGTVRYERVPLLGEDGKPVVRRTATASKLLTKKDMSELHPKMEKHLCKELGVSHVGILLDESDREQRAKRKLSELDHDDYVEVTAEIERAKGECAELTCKIAERQGELYELDDAVDTKGMELEDKRREIAEAQRRLECLQEETVRVEKDVAGLEPIAADIQRFEDAGRAGKREILGRISRACDSLRLAIKERWEGFRERLRGGGSRESRGLASVAEQMREASRGLAAERSRLRQPGRSNGIDR